MSTVDSPTPNSYVVGVAYVDGEVVGPAPAPEPETVDAAVYDPGAYTVDEVEAYVTAHPDEAAAVLAAERAHRGRVTLIDWLEQQEATT